MPRTLWLRRSRRCLAALILIAVPLYWVIWISGIHLQLQELDFETQFQYPMEITNFTDVVREFRYSKNVSRLQYPPINLKYSKFTFGMRSAELKNSCSFYPDMFSETILIMVKSAPENIQNRNAIRATWMSKGIETKNEPMKTLFFIGKSSESSVNEAVAKEADSEQDIIIINYLDTYYNNTIKTMMELNFVVNYCPLVDYALLVDDDYYVSLLNLKSFIYQHKNISSLYAGFKMFPKPLRHRFFNKWFVSLDEYPFNRWPPYITAGAVMLSRAALEDIFYASFYVQPFKFDDIYLAICAKKMGISPIHSSQFVFWEDYFLWPNNELIVSHGFRNPEKLLRFWEMQNFH